MKNTLSFNPVTSVFADLNVVLVHCIGEGKGHGNDDTNSLDPFQAVERVIKTRCEVSCSTVGGNDCRVNLNYFGDIGLILAPKSFEKITHSSASDGGTRPPSDDTNRRHGTNGKNSESEVRAAISTRLINDYNEICSYGYSVVGIFAATSRKVNFHRQSGDDALDYKDFGKRFPDLPMYLWIADKGLFLKGTWNKSSDDFDWLKQPIPIQEMYLHNPAFD